MDSPQVLMVLVDGSEPADFAFSKAVKTKQPCDTMHICNVVHREVSW
jgi:hypothetical protein